MFFVFQLDDIIIDEILSLEDEQRTRQQRDRNASSSSIYERQFSSSAPNSSADLDQMANQDLLVDDAQSNVRDRRKKDIHNMSQFIF